jgi:mutator protein MutT
MNLNFCPNCGQPDPERHNKTEYLCKYCGRYFWNNPKASVAIIFIQDGRVLCSKRAIEPNRLMYDFPGGFVDYGENAPDACVREIQEEMGVTIDPEKLEFLTTVAAEYVPGISLVDLVYVLRSWSGTFIAHDDSLALEWQPVSFISDKKFVPYYKHLQSKLENIAKSPL